MCGIVGGMSSTLSLGELSKIKGLMIMSCFRGMFGSGSMVVVPNKKHLQILTHKTELCAAELMCDEDFLGAISKSPKIVVTHARAPTKGSNDLEFVHPHRTKHITGVHNGTMHRVMDKTVGADESDSGAIFAAIAEHGVEQFIKESRGAYSLVWLDAKDGTLNFLRNDQRPMVMASIGWGAGTSVSTMYFASELSQLHYVLARDGVKLDTVKFESPKPWQHVRFPMDVKHQIVPIDMKQYEDPCAVTAYVGWSAGDYAEYMDSENVTPLQKRIEERREPRRNLPAIIDARRNSNGNSTPTHSAFIPRVEEILARRNAPSAHFRPSDDIKHKNLLRSGPCCVCDNTPSVITRGGTTIYPFVHEIKFGVGYPQYICDDCVQSGNPIALSVLDIPATVH